MDMRNRLLALWWADRIVKKRHKKGIELVDTYPKQQKPPSDYWSESNCFMPKIGARCRAGKNCRCSTMPNTLMKGSIAMKPKEQVVADLRKEREEMENRLGKLGKFIDSEDVDKLGKQQIYLLNGQRADMKNYIQTLSLRISDLLGGERKL